MYLCLCNAVTKETFFESFNKNSSKTFNDLCEGLHIGTKCGICKDEANTIYKKQNSCGRSCQTCPKQQKCPFSQIK